MNLYEQVCRQAGVTARDVSFVEAHGTGTSIGVCELVIGEWYNGGKTDF
jgi:hypothetical protein